MKPAYKKLLASSLIVNAILGGTGMFLFARAYYLDAIKPTLRDYYQNKASLYRSMNGAHGGIVFAGDSLTDRCDWAELLGRCDVINRGIDADNTDGLLGRIGEITRRKPAKLFIMIGGNDFLQGRRAPGIIHNYRKIIQRVQTDSADTIIYIQSVLPTVYRIVPILRSSIKELNLGLKLLADNRRGFYVDVYGRMVDMRGDLNPAYTLDGAHLNGPGYLLWKEAVLPYLR
jgi:lysophospholipase L1-like esterase